MKRDLNIKNKVISNFLLLFDSFYKKIKKNKENYYFISLVCHFHRNRNRNEIPIPQFL